jgi:hypothetical protein
VTFTPRVILSMTILGVGAGWIGSADSVRKPIHARLVRAQLAATGGMVDRLPNSVYMKGLGTAGFDGATGHLLERQQPVDILVLMPDDYLRIDIDPGVQRESGFSGDALLNRWNSVDPRVQASFTAGPNALLRERLHLAQLMVGMIAVVNTSCAFSVSGEPAADSALQLIACDGTRHWLDLDLRTGLPLRLRYVEPVRFPRPLTEAQRKAGIVPPPAVPERAEVTLSFEDRRPVRGVMLPFRIVRSARGVTFEVLAFNSVDVNTLTRERLLAARFRK